ncbi:MAG: hypothetical protein Q4F28_14590 [Eubacteriales bacterium]|nr:hypothetical protein [Eubacteriales bacterium]
MGYFDSAKNRVLWQRELSRLKVERDRRSSTGYGGPGAESKAENEHPGRQRITFAQLEREELESAAKGRSFRSGSRDMEPVREAGMQHARERSI